MDNSSKSCLKSFVHRCKGGYAVPPRGGGYAIPPSPSPPYASKDIFGSARPGYIHKYTQGWGGGEKEVTGPC